MAELCARQGSPSNP